MALSLSNFLASAALLLPLGLQAVQAATVNHEFNISWVRANPDALFERSVMGINGQWPIPALTATKGDRLVIKVNNQLGNETTSLHWHGIYMNGSTHMDGPVGVSQCEIPNGGSFTYNFTIDQPGTYWFHSHTRGQYPDGLRAPLIVEDPDDPYKDQYDEQIILSFSDWYHDLIKPLMAHFISVANPTGAEPVPNAALMNDTQNVTVAVQPGKTYMIRMVNLAAFAAMNVWFEDHVMKVVEVDGIYTEPAEANMLYIAAAQRYSVLLTAKNTTDANFPIVASMDQDLFDTVPPTLNPNVTGWLVYDKSKEMPDAKLVDTFDPFDDFTLVPHDGEKLLDKVDRSITLDLAMNNLGDGANYAFFNNVTYVEPKVPTLYTVMSTGDSATNPVVYGSHTNSFVLNGGETIEIIINNNDPGKHPLHLHGHAFSVVYRGEPDSGNFDPTNTTTPPTSPMRRDTVLVQPNGHVVIRFTSSNPGVWLFHCHIEWHVASGLIATMVEDPLDLQKTLQIPADHYSVCAANSPAIPTAGNAAGNTVNVLDLNGEPAPVNPLPAGFTARGIVALVFSVISAFLGIAVIAWYGAQPIGKEGALGGNARNGSVGNGAAGTGEGVLGREGDAAGNGEGKIERSEVR